MMGAGWVSQPVSTTRTICSHKYLFSLVTPGISHPIGTYLFDPFPKIRVILLRVVGRPVLEGNQCAHGGDTPSPRFVQRRGESARVPFQEL